VENEDEQLNQKVTELHEEQVRWCKQLSIALNESIDTKLTGNPNFRCCVSQWNSIVELTNGGDYLSEGIPVKCQILREL
jgi:hypothetical protein